MLRKLADLINEEKNKKIHKTKDFLDKSNFIIFFKKDDGIFGAPEESRIIFSKMKSGDEGFDGQFSALNLAKAMLMPKPVPEDLFSKNDVPNLKVIDRDEVEDILTKLANDSEAKSCISQSKPMGTTALKYGCGDNPRWS